MKTPILFGCLLLLVLSTVSSKNPNVFPSELRALDASSNSTSNSTSNSSNSTSNSSNSSNTSNNSFIYIVPNNPTSRLSTSDSNQLADWISQKSDFTRYNSHFDSVPKVFAPEQDYYENSILVLGLPFYVIGAVIMFIGLLFCIFRYGFGICGGRKSKAITNVTRFGRHCTLALAGIGLTLWFCGAITAIVGASKYNDSLKTTQDSLTSEGGKILSQTNSFSSIANSINSKNLTWPNTTSTSPGGIQNYTLPVSLSYPTITSEAKTINDGSTEFSNYLQSDNKVFQGFLWFFFVIGLLMGGILIYSIIKQLGSIANVLGIAYILLSAMAFGVAGFYFSQTFKVSDICQQNREIINKDFPNSGDGILKYMNRFSNSAEKVFSEERYQTTTDLQLACDFYLQFLQVSHPNIVGYIQHQTDIINYYNNQSFNDTNLNLWGKIVSDLDITLRNINDLKDLVGIREYSVVSESNFCFVGLPNLYLGFVGILIQGIAFFLLLIAGIQLKEILEKLRTDKESMINIRQAGGYA